MEITELRIYQVNAFTEGNYLGNPAGVCLLPSPKDGNFYRKVAAIMGFSETAFVCKEGNGFRLRWFSPNGTEVDLCGHATLATASILFRYGFAVTAAPVNFQTRSGVLTATARGENIEMDFPAEEIFGLDGDAYGLDKTMGVHSTYTGRTRFDAFIEVATEAEVKKVKPDFERLKLLPGRGVIVTARSAHEGCDFISRFFAPKYGINEDPVTGSAHCGLGVYWGYVLGKESLVGYQASPEGGIVRVKVLGERVILSGKTREIPLTPERRDAMASL
jgi:PhzF family phenazine biosynthesis protein